MVQPSGCATRRPAMRGPSHKSGPGKPPAITIRRAHARQSFAEMPLTNAILCSMICGSTKDQQLTRKKKRCALIAGESTICKMQAELNNSYKTYTNTRPLSRPLEAFFLADDPQPMAGRKKSFLRHFMPPGRAFQRAPGMPFEPPPARREDAWSTSPIESIGHKTLFLSNQLFPKVILGWEPKNGELALAGQPRAWPECSRRGGCPPLIPRRDLSLCRSLL
jgi:hypothetical protein